MGTVGCVHCRDFPSRGLVCSPLDDVGVAYEVEVPRLEALLSNIRVGGLLAQPVCGVAGRSAKEHPQAGA